MMCFAQANSPLFASAVHPCLLPYARAMKTTTFEFQKTTESTFAPFLPICLQSDLSSTEAIALLATGAAVNVLPFHLGLELGLDWNQQSTPVTLTGNLAQAEARGVLLQARVADFKPVKLVFAWSSSPDARLILGTMNFFLEFDVLFSASKNKFKLMQSERKDGELCKRL
jgi:hypothetical protein